jgi:hypothetical protein
MTLTLSENQVYVGIILVLMGIQIYQWRVIVDLKKQVDQIWTQIAITIGAVAKEIKDLENKIEDGKK